LNLSFPSVLFHCLIATGIAVGWVYCVAFNEFLFRHLDHNAWAGWVYLPAAMRIICVLLFARIGALGLVLGTFYTTQYAPQLDLLHSFLVAVTSGLAPLLAVWLCRRVFRIAPDLRGLRPVHILVLSILGAAMNACLINSVVALSGHPHFELLSVVIVFLGDLSGTAIVLFVLSTALALLMPRLPGITRQRMD